MRLARTGTRVALALAVGMAAIALVSAGPGAAHPPAPYDVKGKRMRGTYHRWLHQAKVPLVRGRIRLVLRGCPRHPQFAACVISSRPRRIYLKRDLGRRQARMLLYHELGHMFDLRVLNNRERRDFRRIVGRRGARWLRTSRPPGEWFADGYSLCARHRTIRRRPRRTPYGYRPSPRTHRRVCRLIRRAAAPGGRHPQPPNNPPPVFEPPAPPPPPPPPPGESPPPPERCSWLEALLGGCR